MSDLLKVFNSLRRPKLLIRAARIGSANYRRERDLRRLIKSQSLPKPGSGLTMLMAMEQDLEVTRKTGNATYSISRHVEILAALIAEAACLAQNQTV
ncbi:MAG: hypothetical protein KDA67_05120 [Rhodobacteraceae bacterium]|nr:hypothetical protein [Paracoccaceae bacterium]